MPANFFQFDFQVPGHSPTAERSEEDGFSRIPEKLHMKIEFNLHSSPLAHNSNTASFIHNSKQKTLVITFYLYILCSGPYSLYLFSRFFLISLEDVPSSAYSSIGIISQNSRTSGLIDISTDFL